MDPSANLEPSAARGTGRSDSGAAASGGSGQLSGGNSCAAVPVRGVVPTLSWSLQVLLGQMGRGGAPAARCLAELSPVHRLFP